MVGSWNGKLERRGVTRLETRQVSVTSARFLRAFLEICFLRQMVRVHWQGQLAQCLAYTLRSIDISGR